MWLDLKYNKNKLNPPSNRVCNRMKYKIRYATGRRKTNNNVVIFCTGIKWLFFNDLKHLIATLELVRKIMQDPGTFDTSPGRSAGRGDRDWTVGIYWDTRAEDGLCVSKRRVRLQAGPITRRNMGSIDTSCSSMRQAENVGGSCCFDSGSAKGVRTVLAASNAVLHPGQPP